jgi:hypothetical protein
MNGRQQAIDKISDFIQSDKKMLLLNGTFQNEKHVLVLNVLQSLVEATVLFRLNRKGNEFLSDFISKTPAPGSFTRADRLSIAVDTMSSRTWVTSPREVGVGIVYPLDSLHNRGGDECMHDMMRRAQKVFAVTWTDNVAYHWMDQFDPVRVTFDCEEERSDYHERMQEHVNAAPAEANDYRRPIVPGYAENCPTNLLMRFRCDRCSSTRWGKLNKPNPGQTAIRNAKAGEFTCACLSCGNVANDNYKWYGID